MLTGQIIVRETGESLRNNEKLMIIVGVVSVPTDWSFKGEHQYVVTGTLDNTTLLVHKETEVDLTERLRGLSISNILTSPIWRI